MKTKTFKNRKIAVLGSVSLVMGALVAGNAQAGAMKADFNGDGYEDLVVAVPKESFGNTYRAGAVKVVYGRSDGRMERYSKTTYIHQGKYGEGGINLYGTAQSNDGVGYRIAVGDFNNDTYDDLAIAVPSEKVGSLYGAGIVNIVYGSSEGLIRQGNHYLSLLNYKNGTYLRANNYFGSGLAVGDFDGDGIEDLGVGFQGGYTAEAGYRGGVAVFFGDSNKGLKYATSAAKTHLFLEPWNYFQRRTGFGVNLASGDFNNDGKDDLAIAAPDDKVAGIVTGTVSIAYGRSDWNRYPRTLDKIEPLIKSPQGRFGTSMAAGDFSGNGRDELAIGMPMSSWSSKYRSGIVLIARFNGNGTTSQNLFFQSQPGIPGKSVLHDHFGQTLTVADFNGDGNEDLAIGIPNKTKESYWSWKQIDRYGEVIVMYSNGSSFYKTSVWHQDSSGVEGGREDYDMFSSGLSSGDFNNDGIADLLVGASGEDLGSIRGAGSVQLIWGNSNGLTTSISGKQLFHQGSFSGVGFGAPENEAYDAFGRVLLP